MCSKGYHFGQLETAILFVSSFTFLIMHSYLLGRWSREDKKKEKKMKEIIIRSVQVLNRNQQSAGV